MDGLPKTDLKVLDGIEGKPAGVEVMGLASTRELYVLVVVITEVLENRLAEIKKNQGFAARTLPWSNCPLVVFSKV